MEYQIERVWLLSSGNQQKVITRSETEGISLLIRSHGKNVVQLVGQAHFIFQPAGIKVLQVKNTAGTYIYRGINGNDVNAAVPSN